MNHVLAKVKGNAKKTLFKLISDQSLFETIAPNTDNYPAYSPDHNLDEDDWYKLTEFSKKVYCIDLLKKDFDSKDYNDLTKDKFTKIAWLCAVQGANFYFQKITPSLFLRKKMIAFGEAAEVENTQNRLVINTLPDAIYLKKTDTLIFRNLATISSIFKGIDMLYKEATDAEVKTFLDQPFIKLANDFGVSRVSKPNRKRIALAMTALESMSAQEKTDMLGYVDGYCQDKLKFDEKSGKFEVSSDEELKLLLYGVEQRFYTTPFGGEKRIANSVIPIT